MSNKLCQISSRVAYMYANLQPYTLIHRLSGGQVELVMVILASNALHLAELIRD